MVKKAQAKENLVKLVEKFRSEIDSGRAQEYNEEETKHSFIEPFLKDVLGWDVANHNEVGYEHPTSRGRVDYSLKIDGKIKLFIEAKPIHVDLGRHIPQAVGYGYSRKDVPFVLLTDFEGIKLFDVTIKPSARNLRKGLKLDLSWQEYEKWFDKLWLLSRESVAKGDLDKLLLVKPKDRLLVDKAILEDLKEWREVLAKDIYHNNPELFSSQDLEKDSHYLKEITQKILDRLTFIRFCEDRRLSHINTLKDSFEERTEALGIKAYEIILKDKFKQYQILFNSDLFAIQDWEEDLKLDFSILSDIVIATYDPYQFDVIPLEVLGNIYEQYLGYTIRLTGQQVKYELKSEVRKAGGVYYTPEYIVDYIVKNTVGKLLEELPPVKAKRLRVLDPACGSGSFLIRAYEEMLEFYRKQKKIKPKQEGQAELELEHKEQGPKLSINEKREILRQHIFGVDIDEQAVEVTKLSLMLKMLEGEYGFIAGSHLLPMLDHNIRCGNSLISSDTLELKKYFGDEWYKVNPFNWEKQFPEITKEGGFDVVIGNPPYVRPHKLNNNFKKYLWDYYRPIFEAKSDLYVCFIKRSLDLLKQSGLMSFIVSKTWLSLKSFSALRQYILSLSKILLVSMPPKKVFEKATVETVIVVLQREKNGKERSKNKIQIAVFDENKFVKEKEISQEKYLHTHLNLFDLSIDKFTSRLNEKMQQDTLPLHKCVQFFYGLKTGDDEKFISTKKLSTEYKKLLRRSDFSRYGTQWNGEYVWYIPNKMTEHRKTARPGTPERFETSKIMVLDIAKKIVATLDEEKYYVKDALLFVKKEKFTLKYLLAIINSRLLNYYYAKTFTTLSVAKNAILTLPIRTIDFSNSSDKQLHDNLVALVNVMLNLNKKFSSTQGSEKDQLQKQIETADKEIDGFVYKLYGITEEEKRIIEGAK